MCAPLRADSLPECGPCLEGYFQRMLPERERRATDRWKGTAEMLPKTESATFVIADISGYTTFLAGVELDHAHDIIADVMATVARCLRPPFRLAKFEGDAAFFYAVNDKVDGSLFRMPSSRPTSPSASGYVTSSRRRPVHATRAGPCRT